MDKLIEYIQFCIKPRDSTEFYINDLFDENIFLSMKQDGIYICKQFNSENITNYEYVQIGSYYLVKKCIKNLYWLNNDGTVNFDQTQEPLYRRLLPPPDESVNHPLIIYSIIKETSNNNKTYIEYGVREGTTLNFIASIVEKAYGVDYNLPSVNLLDNCEFHQTYTTTFSENKLPNIKYQYAFIDADHNSKAVLKDFDSIYKYIDSGGYIFLHDTYPCDYYLTLPDKCYDCYKSPIIIKENYPNIEIVTLPLNPGLTIIRKN